MPLNTRTIQSLVKAQQPGMWAHTRGLYLVISVSGSATWALRYSTKSGKRRVMTLEPFTSIDAGKLKALEMDALEYRKTIRSGGDPLADREAADIKAADETKRNDQTKIDRETFEDVARDYVTHHKSEWKNPKHAQQWENTLTTYVYPIIGTRHPHQITSDDVLLVLRQPYEKKGITGTLWLNARETASRVRSRIEIIIGAAKAKGISNPDTRALWRDHHNPAQWKDNLAHWLSGKQSKGHFKAMDWNDAPSFVRDVIDKPDFSAKALAFTILCATR